MPFDKCDTGRCSIALSALTTTKRPQRLFKPVKVKRLELLENTPLGTSQQDFVIDILLFDNIVDENGEIPYENYTIIRTLFEDGKISDYIVLQDGIYEAPENYIGWSKEKVIAWIKYGDRMSNIPGSKRPLTVRAWSWEYETYRAPIILE